MERNREGIYLGGAVTALLMGGLFVLPEILPERQIEPQLRFFAGIPGAFLAGYLGNRSARNFGDGLKRGALASLLGLAMFYASAIAYWVGTAVVIDGRMPRAPLATTTFAVVAMLGLSTVYLFTGAVAGGFGYALRDFELRSVSTLFEDSAVDVPFVIDSPAVSIDYEKRAEVAPIISDLFDQLVIFVISSEREHFVSELDSGDIKYCTIHKTETPGHVEKSLDQDYFMNFQSEAEEEELEEVA